MNSKAMFFKKLAVASTGVISIAVVLFSVINPQSSLISTLPFISKGPINSISGLPGRDGPVLVVKIDDTRLAHPQIGLEDADIIYIEQVEAGLTRLAAVFSSRIPQRIGPVRSARISDIEILEQFGRVAFAYSGAQKKLLPVIAAANLQNLGAQAQPPTIYTRDPTRVNPYSMVLRADLLMAKVAEKSYVVDTAKSVGWSFGDAPSNGVQTTSATMHWPAARYRADWSAKDSCWLLFHNSHPDVVRTGKQLCPTTLVIQLVSITDSEYHDKVGGVTPFSNTVGSGTGFILRNGQTFAATWVRNSADVGTTWTDAQGAPILFAPGQVWVALTDKAPDFTHPIPQASTSATK
jgi:hypothetical protein